MTILETSLQNMLSQLPIEQRESIRLRYQAQAPVLLKRLQTLYGHTADFEEWFASLLSIAGKLHAVRPDALRALDQQRTNTPEWFSGQQMVGYCAYVDRFAGTLNGVREKIGHLTELGVTYLHLLPFLRARDGENDGGFAVARFDEIEPSLGTMEDLQILTDDLRAAGISLCSDFILNHVADDHPWALAAKNGDCKAREYFCTYPDRKQPDAYERSLGQVFPQVAPGNFSYCPELRRWVWTTFYPYQWDLNYANPDVFAEMVVALLKLANRGIEVFRLDSTAFLWKREGSNCMNQPEAHWILQAMRCIVDIVAPGVLLKAEAIVPTLELPAYFGERNPDISECHLAYHSSLMAASWAALASQNCDLLREVIRATPQLMPRASWLTYVRCHDDIGWNVLAREAGLDECGAQQRLSAISRFFSGDGGSFARGASFQTSDANAVHGSNGMTSALTGFSSASTPQEMELALRRLLLLYGLAFCFGGLPLIYMGDEFAQANDESNLSDHLHSGDGRWTQRPFLDRRAYSARHDRDSDAGKVFASLCHLLACRRALSVLSATVLRTLLNSGRNEVLAFLRGAASELEPGGDCLVYVGNFSDREIGVNMRKMVEAVNVVTWRDQLSQRTVSDSIALDPWSQLWLKPAG